MRLLKTLVILLCLTTSVSAQQFRVAGLDYVYYPKANAKEGDEKIDYQEMSAYMQFPLVFNNNRDVLINKLSYGLVTPTLHNPSDHRADRITENYHAIGYGLSWLHTFDSQWLLVIAADVAIDSDLHRKISGDDFIVGTFGMIRYTIDKNLKIGVGITYSTTLGQPLWLPVGEVEYKTEKLTASVVFPSKASIIMTSNDKKLRYGVSGSIGGNNFNLGNFISDEGVEVDKVRYSRINVGPVVEYDIAKGFTLTSSVGVTTNRIFKFELADSDRLATYNTKAGPFLGIGLHYTISQ